VQTFPSKEAELSSLMLMDHITDELQYETALVGVIGVRQVTEV
jgi:hypothetical protein